MTDAERERLVLLIEECGEVVQMATKILRHGYDNYHPNDPVITNRELLEHEIDDIMAVLKAMDGNEINLVGIESAQIDDLWNSKKEYTYHQGAE